MERDEGRQSKGKARLNAYEKMAGEEVREKEAKLELWIPNGQRLGDKVIELRNISKSFGDRVLFENLNLDIPKNAIVGIIGPNGAGKTTTISMVMGVLEPTKGSVTIAGFDVAHDRSRAMSNTNFAAVYAALPGNLTIRQNLEVFALMYGIRGNERIQAVMEKFDLGRFEHTKAGLLSSGEQTRLALAKAMLNTPKLLLLDEPTASLDPSSAKLVREKIQAFAAKGGSVLWTSHNMHEVTDVCSRVLFLSH
jgi:ABC-2 type transport system ATP-binding protein